ncbi:MAG: sigma-E processing peptidase SpoIIGA [Clostridia bacterium]|nr:sigma-E processing peptidase SpoIIGA [Clostridia bacterium]
MEIYLDVLFLENVVMNYLILLVTSKFAKMRISSLRLFIGALIGALYVVFLIFNPGIKVYYTTFAKIVLSFAIIAVTFAPEKVSAFFKTLAIFYVSTFIFAGAALAFLYFNNSGGFVENGIVYVFGQSKWTLLVFSIVTVGIIIRIFWEILQYRVIRERLMIPLKISFESRIISLAALIDTGNSLHDPLTNTPVIVVEFKAVRDILPQEIQGIFENSKENDLFSVTDIIAKSTWFSRFRVIPFTSLGKENGMLIGFKPDYIEIGESEEKKGVNDVIVGIYNRALSKNERYKALLGPELVG